MMASVFVGAQPVYISFPQAAANLKQLQDKALFKCHSSTRELATETL